MAPENPFDSIEFLHLPFALHARALGLEYERACARGDEPATLAFLLAALVVTRQLSAAETALEAAGGDRARLDGLVRSAWVLGYVFGAVAAALERNGVESSAPGAAGAQATVHQLVLREPDPACCQRISDAAVREPGWAAGMLHAAEDLGPGGGEGADGKLAAHLRARLAGD